MCHRWGDSSDKANEHNALVPRDHWLEPAEKQAIIDLHDKHPLEGYRRLSFMGLDFVTALSGAAAAFNADWYDRGRRIVFVSTAGEFPAVVSVAAKGEEPTPGTNRVWVRPSGPYNSF